MISPLIGERVSVVREGSTVVFNGLLVDIIKKGWFLKYDTQYVVKMDSEWPANELWKLNPKQVFRTLDKK